MTTIRLRQSIIGILTFSLSTLATSAQESKSDETKDKEAKKNKVVKKGIGQFTISMETTYITEPLDKDGYPDYATSINQRLSKGVTPENNGCVLIWKAFGPHPENSKMPPEYFKWLGIEEPPAKGTYFLQWDEYLEIRGLLVRDKRPQFHEGKNPKYYEDQKRFGEQLDRVLAHAWTEKENRVIVDWLKMNERPLALINEATKRQHFYWPIVPDKSEKDYVGLRGARLPESMVCRECGKALVARAMLNLGRKDFDAAWQDLILCHRLARSVAQGGTLIHGLAGFAIDAFANNGDLAFIDAGPEAKCLAGCANDLTNLPELPSLADKMDLTERCLILESTMLLNQRGIDYLGVIEGMGDAKGTSFIGNLFWAGINWDPGLVSANELYDQFAAAMLQKDYPAWQKSYGPLSNALLKISVNAIDKDTVLDTFAKAGDSAKAKGTAMGNILISLFTPAIGKVQIAYFRASQVHDNIKLAFALARYERDNGKHPEKLDALAPKYLPRIPKDIFTAKDLTYRTTEKGYLLYSFGVNQKDDDGKTYNEDPPGDDIVVRMPLAPPKAKR